MHLDIKPDNILIESNDYSLKESGTLYLLDFGISKRYLDKDNNHINMKTNISFVGNLVFASKHAFCEIGKILLIF